MPDAVLGLDAGTSGVRCVAADANGDVLASAERRLTAPHSPREGWFEQSPEEWWTRACECLAEVVGSVGADRVAAICPDSTSGTLVALDGSGAPLRPAILYNDLRAAEAADGLNAELAGLCGRMGYRFNASHALAKALWMVEREPALAGSAHWRSPADFLVWRLTGSGDLTDYANALKMGYDLVEDRWPDALEALGIVADRLPRVMPTGAVAGTVCADVARLTGLTTTVRVVLGPTDGVAAFYASGAARPGDAATTLGTTLVVKELSRAILRDPTGRVYSHRHASGLWLPGGASNCGGAYLTRYLPGADLEALSRLAERSLPASLLLYPLPAQGERFPVAASQARRLLAAEPANAAEHFAAYLQGMAFVERWCYELLGELGGPVTGEVFTSGGGSRSDLWMQARADVLSLPTVRTAAPDSAFGCAVLAAAGALHPDLESATRAMVRVERRFDPHPAMTRRYAILYRRFRAECAAQGWA